MMQNWKDVARATLAGSEDGALRPSRPACGCCARLGVEGYASSTSAAPPAPTTRQVGEALEVQTEVTAERGRRNASTRSCDRSRRSAKPRRCVQGYTYKGLLRQGGRGRIAPATSLSLLSATRALLLRPHRRVPHRSTSRG